MGKRQRVVLDEIHKYPQWKNNHISLITTEDVRDLSRVIQTQKLQTLVFLIHERVGAPLSLNRLKIILSCDQSTPLVLIECKTSDKNLAPQLTYFKERLKIPLAIQVIQHLGYVKQIKQGVFIPGIDRLLNILP